MQSIASFNELSLVGNLRQMKNIVKRATLLAQSSFITLLELGTELLETPASSNTSIAFTQ